MMQMFGENVFVLDWEAKWVSAADGILHVCIYMVLCVNIFLFPYQAGELSL